MKHYAVFKSLKIWGRSLPTDLKMYPDTTGCMFVSLKNSYVEILNPNDMVLGSGALGKWLGPGVWDLMNGINAFIKEILKGSFTLPPCEDTALCEPGSRISSVT